MTIEVHYSVMSPEIGIQMGAIGPRPGAGGPPPVVGAPVPPSSAFARRLDTLENKTVYLVDLGFGGSYKFMIQLQKWFKEHMPSVTTIRKRKGDTFFEGAPDLWEEIKVKGHAVVVGVAG